MTTGPHASAGYMRDWDELPIPLAVTDREFRVLASNGAWKSAGVTPDGLVTRFPLPGEGQAKGGYLLVGSLETSGAEVTHAQSQSEKMAALAMLAGGIAHEFNNLMGGLLGYAQLAEKTGETADYRRAIQAVYQSATRARDVVGAMLGFVGRPMDRSDPTTLTEVVTPILTMVEAGLRNENIEVDTRIDDAGEIVLDVGRAQQVLLNLVIHARARLRDAGGGVVSVAARVEGRFALIRVADSLSAEPNGAAARSISLATGRAVLREIGGDIREHQDGARLSFEMLCPVGPAGDAATIDPDQEFAGESEPGGRILVVDDESMVRDLLAHVLGMHGYETQTASTGFSGVEKARHLAPELVSVDAQMPGMSGIETCAAIRKEIPNCAFLMVTGAVGDELERIAGSAGGQGIEIIAKPFEIEAVLGHVRRLVALVRAASREMS
ncbi:MAG: response regulator [Deltaproteobacteria bacterium]|nr:response regulator [Deltaproteobacteria bacterium]